MKYNICINIINIPIADRSLIGCYNKLFVQGSELHVLRLTSKWQTERI